MDDLTQPLIKETTVIPEVQVINVDENDITRSREHDSSFIEIKDTHRATSLPVAKGDIHDVKRAYSALPVLEPSDRLPRNQSVIVSGDDRFIVEESVTPTIELDGDGDSDGGDEYTTSDFINVHVSLGLEEYLLPNIFAVSIIVFIMLLVYQREQ